VLIPLADKLPGLYTPDQLAKEIEIARVALGTDKSAPLRSALVLSDGSLMKMEEIAHKAIKLTLDKGVHTIWFAFGNDLYKWIQVVRKYDLNHNRRTLIFVQVALPEEFVLRSIVRSD